MNANPVHGSGRICNCRKFGRTAAVNSLFENPPTVPSAEYPQHHIWQPRQRYSIFHPSAPYEVEDLLQEACGIRLLPTRKKNSQRPVPGYVAYLQAGARKMVETAGSLIERLLPKSIHAVTSQGYELKVMLFVLAYSFSCAL